MLIGDSTRFPSEFSSTFKFTTMHMNWKEFSGVNPSVGIDHSDFSIEGELSLCYQYVPIHVNMRDWINCVR